MQENKKRKCHEMKCTASTEKHLETLVKIHLIFDSSAIDGTSALDLVGNGHKHYCW